MPREGAGAQDVAPVRGENQGREAPMQLAGLRVCVLLWCLFQTSGCQSFQLRPSFGGRDVVAPTASKDEVVALVNRNITGTDQSGGLMSWSCMQAKFQMAHTPGWATGTLVVEAPRNFRLRVSHPIGGGDMLDVGSNAEEFWIWQKDMNPPYLLTAHHEDMPLALRHFKVPFHPDWIMEVLGVIPIDGSRYELHVVPGKPYVELSGSSVAPSGESVRKVIRVSTRHGRVVEHLLWGATGRLIASASLSDHRVDPATQIVTPRRIRIHWPDADMDLKITLEHLEINPRELPAMVWEVPQKAGYRRLDMGAYARQQLSRGEIQYVEHEAPAAAPPRASPSAAAPDRGPKPFPERPPSGVSAAGPPPFPEQAAPPTELAQSPRDQKLPVRENSVPLDPPGRVRLDALSP